MGLVPEIRRFCKLSRSQLAVSLHATTDDVRDWIAPVNRRWQLAQLMDVLCEHFPAQRGASAVELVADPAEQCSNRDRICDQNTMSKSDATHPWEPRADIRLMLGSMHSSARHDVELGAALGDHSSASGSRSAAECSNGSNHMLTRASRRFVLIEYVMLRGINDTPGDAHRCDASSHASFVPCQSPCCAAQL